MSSLGIPHFCTFEPTDSSIGKFIREILHRDREVKPETTALLFAADRSEHLFNPDTGIISRLKRNELVITDRYLFSSLAYQSIQCGFEFVYNLNSKFPLPECLIYIDTPIGISQKRLHKRLKKDLFDLEIFQKKVRKNYNDILKQYSESFSPDMSITVINGDQPINDILNAVLEVILKMDKCKKTAHKRCGKIQ